MSRKPTNPTAETLEELEHLGDRVVERVAARPGLVLGILAAILLAAAVTGGVLHWRGTRAEAATDALEGLRGEFLDAMGAPRNALDIPEPANPETGRQVRSDFAARFEKLAEERHGTPSEALALLAAGDLRRDLAEPEAALAAWQKAADAAGDRPALRGLLLERVAQLHEQAGRLAEAAQAYEAAGDTNGYPLRYFALAQAARVLADAGEKAKAVALFKRVQAESPETRLPDHLSARLRELDAASR